MQYFIYILYSQKIKKYYIGSTSDISERLKKHNRTHKGFTASGQPWILVYSEAFDNKSEALSREKQLKSWKNKERLEKIIFGYDAGTEHPD